MPHSISSIVLLAISGLVLFLYAVSRLSLALRQVAGERMKGLLDRCSAALKTGFFHLGFNLTCIGVGLLLIGPFTALVLRLAGGADVARQIAHAHVLFNVAVVLVFAPPVPLCQRLLDPCLPEPRVRPEKPFELIAGRCSGASLRLVAER